MNKFKLGLSSLEVVQRIVKNHPDIIEVTIVRHKAEENWRQVNSTHNLKRKTLTSSLNHDKPLEVKRITRDQFLLLSLDDLKNLPKGEVWSFISKVKLNNGRVFHVPMMNFHPEIDDINLVKDTILKITKRKKGVILNSGRFYHYYGDFLLNETDWLKFMADFLMPCIVVSPRYIGHRIYDGYSTLRLTTDSKYKPQIPFVIEIL